jgi:predicted nucleotidyltransferase
MILKSQTMHLVQIVTIQSMVVVGAGAADAHNMYLIRDMVVPRDSVVVALTIALEGVEVNSALAKIDHPVGVVEILMMNHSYHVSYFNSAHPHSAQFS